MGVCARACARTRVRGEVCGCLRIGIGLLWVIHGRSRWRRWGAVGDGRDAANTAQGRLTRPDHARVTPDNFCRRRLVCAPLLSL